MVNSISKRAKITFNSINAGKITVIDPLKIAEARRDIAKAMRKYSKSSNVRDLSSSNINDERSRWLPKMYVCQSAR